MAEDNVYEKVIEEIQNVLMSNDRQTELIVSIDNPSEFKNFNVSSSRQTFNQAYFGFNSSDSKEFSSRTFANAINDDSTYRQIGNKIAAHNLVSESFGNSYKYYINSEAWLEERLKHLDSLESSTLSDELVEQYENALLDLPDLIICPDDVKFSENVTALLDKYNIYVQRVSEKCGETVLGLGDIVKLSQDSSEQIVVVDVDDNVKIENPIFERAMGQLEFDTVSSKMAKYRKIYDKKIALIQEKLDKEYGRTEFENQGKLYTYEKDFGIYQANMNPDQIGNYSNLHNKDGNQVKVSDSDLKVVDNKIDGLMKYVVELYREKDIATYNHITGMLSLIPIINEGLMDDEKLSSKEIKDLERMIVLHDVGKLVIPTPILDKKGKLNDSELEVMHSHVHYENICLAKNDYIHSLLEQALLHHSKGERGYVDEKLKLTSQNKLAQILLVLDVYDALTGDRPYKKPHTPIEAFKIMKEDVYVNKSLSQQYYDALYLGMVAVNKINPEQQAIEEEQSKGNTRIA